MQGATERVDSKNGNAENSADAASLSSIPPASAKLAELQRHLKENESQRTEINGYINQLSIQLHRWQLRLQTLNERNKQLTDEMVGLDNPDRSQA
jgi:chromosome segregation ATPase